MGTLDSGPWRDDVRRSDADFLGQQSSVGNNAGIDLALARLVRWLGARRQARRQQRSRKE